MKVIVFGGSGFVGQYLINDLCKEDDHKVVSVSRAGKINKVSIFKKKYSNLENIDGVDITNYDSVDNLIKKHKPDIVFNLAGFVSFKDKDRKTLNKINKEGALNIFRVCEDNNIKKIIHLSSTAALGYSVRKDDLISEETKFNWSKGDIRLCPYSFSKFSANKIILDSKKIESIVVYPSLILGPGDNKNTNKYINAVRDGKIKLNPPGSNSCVDVRDLSRALLFLMNSKNLEKEYIVSQGNYTFEEINFVISSILGVGHSKKILNKVFEKPLLFLVGIIEYLYSDFPLSRENIFLSFKNRNHDSSRIKKEGFNFEHSLEETIKDSVNWLKYND